MRFSKYGVLAILLCVCIACTGTAQSPTTTSLTSTSSSESTVTAPPSTTSTPPTNAEYALSQIPHCAGIELLDQPVKFAWPNVEQRLKDLAGSAWGYFSCSQPQAVVSAFYREQIIKPPYNRQETNWIDRQEGTLGIYFHAASQNWLYLWIVPQSADNQKSYVIVAITNSEAIEPECRRSAEQLKIS